MIKENDNQEKEETDLTLSEAKDIIKQFDESAPLILPLLCVTSLYEMGRLCYRC